MRLKNSELEIEINTFGAELKSIVRKNIEYLWDGNPNFWKRSSPVLFPIVGRLLDDEYNYKGKTYSMSQHGFARDNDFEMIEQGESKAVFLFRYNEQTLKSYPFKFELYIGYEISGNSITVKWDVKNVDDKEMIFGIGAHPAFQFQNGSVIEINQTTNRYLLNGKPYIQEIIRNVEVGIIKVDSQTFAKDAIVYDNVNKVVLKDDTKSVTIDCAGFPFIGLWSSVKDGENAPFICLEPWHGIADFYDHDKSLDKKKGMNKLSPNQLFSTSYKITVE